MSHWSAHVNTKWLPGWLVVTQLHLWISCCTAKRQLAKRKTTQSFTPYTHLLCKYTFSWSWALFCTACSRSPSNNARKLATERCTCLILHAFQLQKYFRFVFTPWIINTVVQQKLVSPRELRASSSSYREFNLKRDWKRRINTYSASVETKTAADSLTKA